MDEHILEVMQKFYETSNLESYMDSRLLIVGGIGFLTYRRVNEDYLAPDFIMYKPITKKTSAHTIAETAIALVEISK